MADKQDSNFTGLRYAEEDTLGVLPGVLGADAIWYALEPNSYSDFGGQLATIARNPINATRQRKKGAITDLDASGGFNQDLTMNNLNRLMQGFFFADAHEKADTKSLNGTAVTVSSVTAADDKYNTSATPGTYLANDLALASGFSVTANNGLKVVVSADANDLTVAGSPGLTDEGSPPAAARLQRVGHRFASGDISLALNGNLVRFVSAAFTMTTLGLTVGEWVYVGGDATANQFVDPLQTGFARISAITATYLEFDKVSWAAAVDAGTAKLVDLYFGNFLRNEPDPADIVRRTYNIERTLGEDDVGTMSEYLVGAVANEFTLNVTQADKVNADLTFIAIDNEQRNGTTEVKAGTRPTLTAEDAINTSSDFSRIKLSITNESDATPEPLFAYATEMTLTLNNNASPNKAIGVLGAFDVTAGTFEVGGQITAYFANVEAVQAVRENADVTLDMVMAKGNQGIYFDIPLLSLGDGRLNVEQDQPITLPLENNAAESAFGYTFLMGWFPYLPSVAE
jgi:hypothetical protein